ncbi:DUF4041 domain-containing protein [Bremerella cremea]|uniref:DUF4041 domain-containing protein n=1 Tax=Bremerella cremea TaxID=1031537 RepID=A0A368KSK4_9BACT|nr:DUF4041 domain-containing protein [Bremerella cremea]RCS48307.1 DUF4041 domain-containing protein [Bremerella cremea]
MLSLVLGVLCIILTVVASGLGFILFQDKLKLARYSQIEDAEQHVAKCQQESDELSKSITQYKQQIHQFKKAYAKFVEMLGICKSTAEAKERLEGIEAELGNRKRLLNQELQLIETQLNNHKGVLKGASDAAAIAARIEQLKCQLGESEEDFALDEIGMHKRHYNYDTSAAYKSHMDTVVAKQKEMAKLALELIPPESSAASMTAIICRTQWTVSGSEAEGRKMMKQTVKLLLRAFNGECDAAVAKVKYGNYATIEKRITRAFDQINKLGQSNQIEIQPGYLDVRIAELRLAHELELKKEEEKQVQREIREQMAEEAKAEREIEKARKTAEQEEKVKARALEEARQQLADEHGKHNEKLAMLVAKLETELQEALDRKAKAIARAQLTKSGHVYVLSNIGSFGPHVYKIGMTRRLVPDERVKELGDASVPFLFDIHAMIYSEDAPALERQLHEHFNQRRVNRVNYRKEYFRVELEEIIDAVQQYHGLITFVLHPPAPDYRETLAIEADENKLITANAG